jgi:ATP-dependent Clp protease, protease subunit
MNMKLKNQSKKKNRDFSFDKENPSRTITLSSEIDESSVGDIIQYIADINEYDNDNQENLVDYERKPIKLIVNSFGGSVYDGFALIAAIETSETHIHTYCFGSAMSMALLVLVSGDKRYGHKLSTYMYHECLDQMPYDKLSILKENLEETKRVMAVYDAHLIDCTRLKQKQLDQIKNLKKDWYFSAEEALKNGVIDQII